jgi:putative effector of murein hydrolase
VNTLTNQLQARLRKNWLKPMLIVQLILMQMMLGFHLQAEDITTNKVVKVLQKHFVVRVLFMNLAQIDPRSI